MEDLNVDRKIILKCIIKKWDGMVRTGYKRLWMGKKWQAVMNATMNVLVPQTVRVFLTNCATVSFSRRSVVLDVCWSVCLFIKRLAAG